MGPGRGVAQPRLHLGAGLRDVAIAGYPGRGLAAAARPGVVHSARRTALQRLLGEVHPRDPGALLVRRVGPGAARALAPSGVTAVAPVEALVPLPDGVPADELAVRAAGAGEGDAAAGGHSPGDLRRALRGGGLGGGAGAGGGHRRVHTANDVSPGGKRGARAVGAVRARRSPRAIARGGAGPD